MNIGYVLKKFPKLSETFVLNEILALEELGHEITVFSLSLPDETRFHRDVGRLRGEIVQLGVGRSSEFAQRLAAQRDRLESGSPSDWDGLWRLLTAGQRDPLRQVRQALELRLAIGDREIQHLHAHFAGPATDLARAAASMARIQWSFTCHAKDIYHESVDEERFVGWVRDADAVVTVCDANHRYIEQDRMRRPTPHLWRLYNGIDLDLFRPQSAPAADPPVVLGVGRLVEKKGFADLVDAIALLRKRGHAVRCLIVGEGRERGLLESRIAEESISEHVELLGAVDQDRLRRLLGTATVLALPCLVAADGNRDALPTVILEAMAAGVPVVSTPVGGIEEMIDDGRNGLLVTPRRPNALADAIEAVLHDPNLRERLQSAGRATAEQRFDLRKNVAQLAEIFAGCSTQSHEGAIA